MRYVIIDFETASCVDLKKAGAWRYSEDTSTHILLLAYKIVRDGVPARTVVLRERDIHFRSPEALELLALAEDAPTIFVAHNAGFEQAIWANIMVERHGWPSLPVERWHDTMAVAARKTLPLSLDRLAGVLALPVGKDKEGANLMRRMSRPNRKTGCFEADEGSLERLAAYNKTDVEAQYHAHLALGGLGWRERRVWILNETVNARGVLVDIPYVETCITLLSQARRQDEARFAGITGGLKPSQTAKLLEWVNARGVYMPNLRKDTLDAALEEPMFLSTAPSEVIEAVRLRRMLAASSVAKLERMIDTACRDNRVRGMMQYHGARTGRMAGRLVQPQNLPRPTVDDLPQSAIMSLVRKGDVAEINRQCGTVYDAVISTLRGCFRPADGHVVAAGDFNAIEARVVLALAGEHEKARSFDTGDPYSDMASRIFGRPVNKKDNPDLRCVGKSVVLGAGFGMGPARFHAFAASDRPIEFAEQCIMAYRKVWAPLVPALWYGLEKASTRAVWCNTRKEYSYRGIAYQMRGDYLVCRLPGGREIYYYRPEREKDVAPWDDSEEVLRWSYMSFQGGSAQRKMVFGGLLAENVTQAVARDIMVEAMFRCEEAGLPVVFTVHDEIVTEPSASRPDVVETLTQCMEDRSEWVKEYGIPVRAECDSFLCYQK